MNIVCSNCHSGRNIADKEVKRLARSILRCQTCGKNIKVEFCPHCNAFYSITFSNIKKGQYKYKCRKCGEYFEIKFQNNLRAKPPKPPVTETLAEESNQQTKIPERKIQKQTTPTIKKERRSPVPDMESIETFALSELFSSLKQAFKFKKILAASLGSALFLILSRLFISLENALFLDSPGVTPNFLSSFINLFPLAIIFTFFILTATVVAKITLNEIFKQREQSTGKIINFALRSSPSILLGNITVLMAINVAIILFGKIPFLGPLLFSLAFLPLYLSSVTIFIIVCIGTWFYAPIAAHREMGILKNIKNLLIFIKKHNYRLVMVLPVMTSLALIAFGIIFAIHSSALALVVSGSQAFLQGDSSIFFSSIPTSFIRASEMTLSSVDSSIFKGLYPNISMVTEAGGVVLGISIIAITILLMGIFISIVATISTHFYVMLERGLEIEDKKMLGVLSILVLLLTAIIQLKKILP